MDDLRMRLVDCDLNESKQDENSLNKVKSRVVLPFKKLYLRRCRSKFDQKLKKFNKALEILQPYKTDPSYYIEKSVEDVKNSLDLRRELLKLVVNEKIDKYYQDLTNKINDEIASKRDKFDQNIQEIESFKRDLENIELNNNDNIVAKIAQIESTMKVIPLKKELIEDTISQINEKKFEFYDSDQDFVVEKYFGVLRHSSESLLPLPLATSNQISSNYSHQFFNYSTNELPNRNYMAFKQPVFRPLTRLVIYDEPDNESEKSDFQIEELDDCSTDFSETESELPVDNKFEQKFSHFKIIQPVKFNPLANSNNSNNRSKIIALDQLNCPTDFSETESELPLDDRFEQKFSHFKIIQPVNFNPLANSNDSNDRPKLLGPMNYVPSSRTNLNWLGSPNKILPNRTYSDLLPYNPYTYL